MEFYKRELKIKENGRNTMMKMKNDKERAKNKKRELKMKRER